MGRLGSEHNHANGGSSANPASSSSSSSTSTSSSQSHSTNGAAGGGGGGGSPFAHISSSFSSNGSSGSGSRHHRREKPSHSAPHPDTDSALLHSSARSATQPSSNPSPYSSSSLSSKSSLTSSSSAVSASSSSLSESPFFFRTPRLRRRFGNNASTFSSATTTASTSSTTVELSDPSLDSIRQMHTTTQAKVFTKWCNMQLAKLGPDVAVASVLDDLKDGIKLLRLLEALTGIKPPPPEGRGVALRIYHIANVNKALKFIADHAAEPPRQISAEDIVDGNPKLTLGLVWVLIKEWSLSSGAETRSDDLPSSDADFATTAPAAEGDLRLGESAYSFDIARNAEQLSLAPSSVPARSVKEQLLLWVRQILEPYVGIGIMPMITDFTRAWQNGLPFLALVHTFDPLLVPEITEQFARADGKKRTLAIPSSKYLYTTSRKEWAKTLDRAFNLIQTHLSVYRLLDPEDLADVEEPDEKAVMTYVSEIRIALKGIQPFQPGSKVTAQLDGSNRENAKRVIAQCLTECKRLSQWLNRQQEALHRLTSLIYTNESPASLLASLGNSGGWVRRLIALVQDPKGSPESISQGVEEELSKIERSLRQLSPNDSASSPDGGFDSNELTFSQNSLAAARLKVEGYVLKLKSFQSKSRKNDAGITEALETYDALVIQIDSFSAQILPFSSQQLRAYCQFCQDWGKALESLAREFGEDSADSVQVRLDHAHAAQLDLSRVLASVSDTDSATDALKKIRQVETILTSVLGRDISVTKGNTVGELVHSIEHVSFQAENLELPKLRAVENLLAERIQFLEWACLLAKRPRPSTSDFRQSRIGTLSSELNSSQNVLMRSRFTLIPGWVTPQARVFLDKARDVVKTVEEKLIPAFENIVDKCRSFHSSVDTVSVDETVVRQYATSFAKADSLLHDWEGGFRGVDAGNESSSWVAELVAFSRRIQPEVEDFLSNGAAVLDSNWSVIETRVLSDASHIELLPPHNACIQRIGRLLDKLKGVVSSFELERAHKEQEAKSDQQRYFIWKERVVAFEATVMAHADAFLDAAERKIESNGQSIAGVSDFWWNCHDQWQSDLENPDAIGSLETSLIQMVRTFEEGSRDDSWDLKLSWYKIDDESKVLIEQGGILLSELNESLKGSVQDQLRVLDASLSDVRLKRADKSKSVNASSVETLACLSRVEKLVLAATRWLRVRASVHSDVRRILSDITSALTQVEAFTRDPTGKSTVQIEEVLAKSEKTLTAVVAPQIAQWQATYLELVKLAPPEIGQDRPLFEDIEGSLSRELDGAVSMLSDLKTRVEIAVALASVWSELNQAEDLIAHRTSAEQEAVSIPHPLDEACSEQTLVELEKKVANIEGTVTDWQRVMRRAKAEHAVAQLQSLQPEVAIETLVMNRVADILERTEKLVAASRTRWETLNLTRQLFYEVVEPTRAVQVELAAISADVSALSSSLDDAPSGGADVYADLISQAKWLLGRATEVGARLSKCDAIITKRGDSRLRQFFDDVSEGVAKVRASIIVGGNGRTDYICDMVRGRFSQVVKRADLIDAAIHHTESLLLHGEEILGAAKAVKEDITIVKDAIYTLTQSTSWTLDEFQRKMTDTEQQLLDVASMLDQIKDVVSQLAQPADAVDPNPHQHIVFTVCLDAFEDHYNEWNSESENFTKLKSMRLAFDRYSKRAEELKERLALQVAGFNLVSNEVRHEVRLLQSACADGLEKMEPVVALCLHHCSERSAGVAEAQEMLVEVSQSYSELTTEISQVSVGWVAGVRALATSMLEGISSLHSEVHERFDSMKSDTEALSLLAQFAKKVLAVVLPKVVGQIHKIEAGDGWTQVLASVPSDDTVLPLDHFNRGQRRSAHRRSARPPVGLLPH
ncbi:hypothetical protein DFJ73DRAFT_592863 [Zopfochytrium polystomum]|nr:hypothetical protein DFJ73DRAFT_592863 [Zopfochytrium polystomum]